MVQSALGLRLEEGKQSIQYLHRFQQELKKGEVEVTVEEARS